MPIFDYQCQACGHRFDALQKLGEGALRKCPECGKLKLQKLVSAPNFHLKGSGWYKTDFRDKGGASKDGKEGDGAKAGHSMDSDKGHTHGPGCGHDHGSSSNTSSSTSSTSSNTSSSTSTTSSHSHGGSTHSHGPGGHSHKH